MKGLILIRLVFYIRRLTGNVTDRLDNAYLRHHNRQSATCFPLTATLVILAIPDLPAWWKAPIITLFVNIYRLTQYTFFPCLLVKQSNCRPEVRGEALGHCRHYASGVSQGFTLPRGTTGWLFIKKPRKTFFIKFTTICNIGENN